MRALLQRVSSASVSINGRQTAAIGQGLLIFLGVERSDTFQDARHLARKIADVRIFDDPRGKMNISLREAGGEALVVSQFTLCADCRRGRRPSFSGAAPPGPAEMLYNDCIAALSQEGIAVSSGAFQQTMQVALTNEGPATFLLDSKRIF